MCAKRATFDTICSESEKLLYDEQQDNGYHRGERESDGICAGGNIRQLWRRAVLKVLVTFGAYARPDEAIIGHVDVDPIVQEILQHVGDAPEIAIIVEGEAVRPLCQHVIARYDSLTGAEGLAFLSIPHGDCVVSQQTEIKHAVGRHRHAVCLRGLPSELTYVTIDVRGVVF